VSGAIVRDRTTGVAREARPADVASSFARATAIATSKPRSIGAACDLCLQRLGFFDADEIQDAVQLLRYLADRRQSPRRDAAAVALCASRTKRSAVGAESHGRDSRKRTVPVVLGGEDRRCSICCAPPSRGGVVGSIG